MFQLLKKGQRSVEGSIPSCLYSSFGCVWNYDRDSTELHSVRRKIPPNQATKKNLDKDYAEIWWQIDFDKFKSTLDSLDVGECHAPKIFEMLKQRLEQPSVFNPQLVTDFQYRPTNCSRHHFDRSRNNTSKHNGITIGKYVQTIRLEI